MHETEKISLMLVEDERLLAEIISDALSEKGFSVHIYDNGKEALTAAIQEKPDIIVTDIMMPAMDGFTFVKQLRTIDKDTPILFLSARCDAEDVVKGFELGAGDYIRKPFALNELTARINSLLKRHAGISAETDNYILGKYIFDTRNNRLVKDGHTTALTQRETEILKMLCKNSGKLISTSLILEKLWGSENYFTTRSLNVHISNIRKKLSSDPSVLITSARGFGYRLQVINMQRQI